MHVIVVMFIRMQGATCGLRVLAASCSTFIDSPENIRHPSCTRERWHFFFFGPSCNVLLINLTDTLRVKRNRPFSFRETNPDATDVRLCAFTNRVMPRVIDFDDSATIPYEYSSPFADWWTRNVPQSIIHTYTCVVFSFGTAYVILFHRKCCTFVAGDSNRFYLLVRIVMW